MEAETIFAGWPLSLLLLLVSGAMAPLGCCDRHHDSECSQIDLPLEDCAKIKLSFSPLAKVTHS